MKNHYLRSLSPHERPREKIIASGVKTLSNRELFAVIFGSGNRNYDVLEICNSLFAKFIDFRVLSTASVRELQELPGIGKVKAMQIVACMEIARRFHQVAIVPGQTLLSSKQVYQHFRTVLRDEKKEKFFCILLNTKNQILKEELISVGSLNASIVHPREVFFSAIKESANSLLLVHNHPSGDPTPSAEDIHTTNRLIEVGRLVGIRVLDHIVVGNDCYISFAEQNIVHF